jgi:hypothetical protein
MKYLLLLLLLFIGFPDNASAQSIFSLAGCTGIDCTACHVVNLANGIIQWFIAIVFLLFAALIMSAGVKLVTSAGNVSALSDAKEKFINALIGFLIILSAWLIIDTIMRALVGVAGDENSRGMLQSPGGDGVSGRFIWSRVQCQTVETLERQDISFVDLPDVNFNEEFISPSEAVPVLPGRTGSNCGVNEGTLVPIPGQGGRLATPAVANRFVSMQRSLAARGITLTVTSSYRPDSRQTELWDQCPVCQREGTVARPCSRGGNGSRHTSGVALDLTSNGSRADIVAACRAAGASFTMTYQRSGHVHCDWR